MVMNEKQGSAPDLKAISLMTRHRSKLLILAVIIVAILVGIGVWAYWHNNHMKQVVLVNKGYVSPLITGKYDTSTHLGDPYETLSPAQIQAVSKK
jgi:flagellar basal body-associated protein FliL